MYRIPLKTQKKGILVCEEIKLRKYVIVCLLLTTGTHTTKKIFFLTNNFCTQSLESNQNDENCNRK